MAQVWLVTGSSRGLGRAIVEASLAAGNKVLATARDIEPPRDLSERHGDQIKIRQSLVPSKTPMSDFRAQIETNLFGTIIVTKAALPYFRERKAGHFVQFSSMGGRIGPPLRHSDPRITLELYAHVVPQSQRDAVEGLASAISAGQLLTEARIADSAEGKSFVS
jgi:NAD(P)-dependent dehydrogenase (short-subunit alcohol dehydrogenase family)